MEFKVKEVVDVDDYISSNPIIKHAPELLEDPTKTIRSEEHGRKEDEKLLPDGVELCGVDSNIYSLIFTGGVWGVGFWYGLAVCAFQAFIMILIVHDTIDWDSDNPFKMPAGNDFVVTLAQLALFPILPQVSLCLFSLSPL